MSRRLRERMRPTRRRLAMLAVLLLLGQPLLAAAQPAPTQATNPAGDYGAAQLMERTFTELNDQRELPGVADDLRAMQLLHRNQTLNLTLLDDQAAALEAMDASEEVNASIDYVAHNFSYADRGFVPQNVTDPVPVRAHIMDYILDSDEIIQDSGGGTLISIFTETYLVYWAYDADGDGDIDDNEEGLMEANLIDTLAGASMTVLREWVNETWPDDPVVKPIIMALIDNLIDESDLAWVELDVDDDGEDDIQVRLIPIIKDIIGHTDIELFPPNGPAVTIGAEAGLAFELEEINQQPNGELTEPLEIAVVRGLTYPGEDGSDLTYVWTVDYEFSDVPDEYDWSVVMKNFAMHLNASGLNADDMTAINPPYIISYAMDNRTDRPWDNSMPWHNMTPGYIRYDWNAGSTPEEAMEDMTFVKLDFMRSGTNIPAKFEFRLLDAEGEAWESDTVEVYCEPTHGITDFNLDIQYYEYKEDPADINPFMSHIVASLQGVPVGDLNDPRHPHSSLWLEVRNESTDEVMWSTVDLHTTSPIPYLLYGDYEYNSHDDTPVTFWRHDYRSFTGVEVVNLPAQLHLEGNFWLFSGDDPITLYDDPRIDAVGTLINNIMLAVASKIYTIGLMLRAIPGAVIGVSTEGGGTVRVTLRNRFGLPAYIGSASFYYTSHAYLTLTDDSGDDFFTIFNETAYLKENSPAPGRAGISRQNQGFAVSGRISGIGDVFYQGQGDFRNISLNTNPAVQLPIRVYFEGRDADYEVTHWANISLSDIPSHVTLNMTGGALDYSGGEEDAPDRVIDSIVFSSLANGTYTRFELEHLPGTAQVAQQNGDFWLVSDSWFNFSFFITNVTDDEDAIAYAWDPGYDGSYVMLYRDRVGEPDEVSSLAGRMNWLQTLRLDTQGTDGRFRIVHHQPATLRVAIVDRTDYENATEGLNAYVELDPLPTDISVTLPLPDGGSLPVGDVGNVSSLGDIARLIEALAELGQVVVALVSDLTLNLISGTESLETVLSFIYNIDEEVTLTAWIDKGNLALLPEQPRWVQGFWSGQREWGDDLILAVRAYLVGLPRHLSADYEAQGNHLTVNLELERFNHDATADYLLFDTGDLLGPRAVIYIESVPVSLDISVEADLVLNTTSENLTVQGSLSLATSQPVGPIYLTLINESVEQPYRLAVLIPELPQDIAVELDIGTDHAGLNYTTSRNIDYLVLELEVGNTSTLDSYWVDGVWIDMSDEGDIALKAYFHGLPPELSLLFSDPEEGGMWLEAELTGFNSAPLPPENLILVMRNIANKSVMLHLTELPVDLDLQAQLYLSAPDDEGELGMAALDINLSLDINQPLGPVYAEIYDADSDVQLQATLPMVPKSITLNTYIGGDMRLDFAVSEAIPEITLAVDLGDTAPLEPYWTHGIVYRAGTDATALRLYVNGTVTAASISAKLGAAKVIDLTLEGWSPQLPWAYVDLDLGPGNSVLQLYLPEINPDNDIHGFFDISRNVSAGVDVLGEFDISTSTGLGGAYLFTHNRSRPARTELYLSEVPHHLKASVLSGHELDIRYWATDRIDLVWVKLDKFIQGEWRSAYALVHDVPTYFHMRVAGSDHFDMDHSFILQGLPQISVQTSSREIDVVLLIDQGYTGGFTSTTLDATNLGNHTTLKLVDHTYVIDSPEGIDRAYYRLEGVPTIPLFTLDYLEIHAYDVYHVEITAHQLLGIYPVFELSHAEGGDLSYAAAGRLTTDPVELDAMPVMLEIRFREVAGVPLIPTWLSVQRGGSATELGEGERHYIVPEPITSLLSTLGESL